MKKNNNLRRTVIDFMSTKPSQEQIEVFYCNEVLCQTNDSIEDDGLYRALLKSIGWNTTDSATVYNVYDFDLEDFKTDPISLN